MFKYITDLSECLQLNPFPGVRMSVQESETMTMSLVEMEPNAVIPEHSHPHEQVGIMLSGAAEFIIEGESYQVRAGQMWRLPGGTAHKVVTAELAMSALDVFYPIREDYRRA